MTTKKEVLPGLEDLEHNLCYQLWRASNAWQRALRRELEPIGLTHTQFLVLSCAYRLSNVQKCVTQSKVCEVADLDENLTSQVVRSLEAKGLLDRLRHPDDGRALSLVPTPAGKVLVEQAKAKMVDTRERFISPVGDRRTELTELLRTIADSAE